MAIATITMPFSSRALKLSLPRRLRPKPNTATPPPPNDDIDIARRGKEDEFRRVFRFLDADNDGTISADELTAYFAAVGDSVSREEAERIIGEFSRGGDLLLEFEEFVRVMELREGGDGEILRRAFEVYEEEKGSGCITAEGLRQVLRRLGDVKSVRECKAMIRAYDLDGNGVLDFHEFCKMMS
ncbi:probable calcium-binding protein CML41 [Salvia miltiorrhiza]|uniref:probable calcium-binding protein CML41 n=1 Tax=Salvia miltiorrhiza TaxID=226208 RepID=UPI0025AD28DA|nr:probable calcium-binding protein CML41 [Salvia miltiorrhiza]